MISISLKDILEAWELIKSFFQAKELTGDQWMILFAIITIGISFIVFGNLVTLVLCAVLTLSKVIYNFYIKRKNEKALESYQLLHGKTNALLHQLHKLRCIKPSYIYPDYSDFSTGEELEYKEKLEAIDKKAKEILPKKHFHYFTNPSIELQLQSKNNSLTYYCLIVKSKVDYLNNLINSL